jgi:hypothetical protein
MAPASRSVMTIESSNNIIADGDGLVLADEFGEA